MNLLASRGIPSPTMADSGFKIPYQVVAKAPRGEWQPTPPQPAEISWETRGAIAKQFDDVYFRHDDGLGEVRHVFHEGCGLPDAWKGAETYTIAELGFGTGLSFLATWQAWREENSANSCLHYISFERSPLTLADLEKIHGAFPELASLSERLRQKMPLAVAGAHRIEFPDDNLYLTLFLGEAREFLPLVEARVDAWFLDGFSPAKNPDFWTKEIFQEVARLSRAKTRLATFSAARVVKDNLSAVGFRIEKRSGLGQKREVLAAVFLEDRMPVVRQARAREPRVAVIGGGLAGSALAYSFAKRNWRVTLIEEEAALAQKASGNAAAVLMAYLSAKPDFLSRFFSAAYQYSLRLIAELEAANKRPILHRCGVIRLTSSKRLEKVYTNLEAQGLPEEFVRALTAEQVSALCGFSVSSSGLQFPMGGWLCPALLCEMLTSCYAERVQFEFSKSAVRAEEHHECWSVSDREKSIVGDCNVVVFANGYRVTDFDQLSWLPVEKVRGQVQTLGAHESVAHLKSVLCYDGYIVPAHSGEHFVGATYNHNDDSEKIDPLQAETLRDRLGRWAPTLNTNELQITGGRVGFRTMSPDRLPILGPIPRLEGFEEAYKAANSDRYGPLHPRSADLPGLYASVGHGSRGLLSCLLGAELIASQACQQPLPLEFDLVRAVDPCRFLVRAVKRGQLQ